MLAGEETDVSRLAAAGMVVLFTLLALHCIVATRPVAQLNVPQLIVLGALGVTVAAMLIWDGVRLLEGALALNIFLILLWVSGLDD